MKILRSIVLLFSLLQVSLYTQAQVEVVYPEQDPVRLQQAADRPLRQASVTGQDTTRLPFFEDFTTPLVPVKSVVNIPTAPWDVTCYNLHDLQDGDSIMVYRIRKAQGGDTLNGIYYVKKIDLFEFKVYQNKALTIPRNGNGQNFVAFKWAKLPYDSLSVSIPPSPNPLKWESNNGGTYINDRYPLEPPSYNVATFDGLNYQGVQYNTSNFNAQGLADNLTSAPIDLSFYTPVDSIYLSFFWQCGGIGELPEDNDYLVLEFKDNSGFWNEVWRMYGNDDELYTKHFTRANVVVKDPTYFYKGFQFRFKNRGRQSGPFDVWNLDHIYMNTGRQNNDIIPDWSISSAPHTFLKNYTAMPYKHFFQDVANQVNTTNTAVLMNQKVGDPGIYYVNVGLYNYTNNAGTPINISPSVFNGGTYDYIKDFDLTLNYSSVDITTSTPQLYNLYYQILWQTDTDLPVFDRNNFYSTSTVLWDYYAYDDGTPEYAIKTVASGVTIANQYVVGNASTDLTLTAIDICFTRNAGVNVEGRTVFLNVWGDNPASYVPGSALHSQSIEIDYPEPFYDFVRYELNTPLALNALDTFYVGFAQNFTDPVFTGYDGSVNRADKMFYNDGYGWTRYDKQLGYVPGALMIRPVFDNGQILTPVTPPSDSFASSLYPNPADDLLYIDGDIAEVVITDLLGRTVLTYNSSLSGNAQHTLHTDTLSEGLYLVRITSPTGAVKTEKLLIK